MRLFNRLQLCIFILIDLSFARIDLNPYQITPETPIGIFGGDAFSHYDRVQFIDSLVLDPNSWWYNHDPTVSVRNTSAIKKSLAVNGHGANDYLSTNHNWAFFQNDVQLIDPLRLSPLFYNQSFFFNWDYMRFSGNALNPYAQGYLGINGDNGLSTRYQQLITGYSNDGNRFIVNQTSFGTPQQGGFFKIYRALNNGERLNAAGHLTQSSFNYAYANARNQWLFSFDTHDATSDINSTIPVELADLSNNEFFLAPNQDVDRIRRGNVHWNHVINDRTFLSSTSSISTLDFDKTQSHTLPLATNCTSETLAGQLCINGIAIVDQNNNTLTPAQLGNPRAFGEHTEATEKHVVLAQTFELQNILPERSWSIGLIGRFAHKDYDAQSFLNEIDENRDLQQLTLNDAAISINGTKSTSTADVANSSLSPAHVSGDDKHFSLYGLYREQLTPKLQGYLAARYDGVFYNVTDEDTFNPVGAIIAGEPNYQFLNPMAGVVYSLNEHASLFSQIYMFSQAPSLNALYCSDPNEPCYFPKMFYNKGDLDQSITGGLKIGARGHGDYFARTFYQWGLQGFLNHTQDDIITVPTDWMRGFYQNIDDTEQLGMNLHFELSHGPIGSKVDYQFMHATYGSAFSAPTVYTIGGTQNVQSGDFLPGIPSHSVRWNSHYQVSNSIQLLMDVIGVGSKVYYGNFSNNTNSVLASDGTTRIQLDEVPGYALMNVGMIWRPKRYIETLITVDNVFNKNYYTDGTYGQAPDPAVVPVEELGDTGTGAVVGIKDPKFVMPGMERIWRVVFKFSF